MSSRRRAWEAELSEGGADLARVGGRRGDEYVQILCRARPAVSGERVSPDQQEPDPMALQGAEKLGPVGRELHRRRFPMCRVG